MKKKAYVWISALLYLLITTVVVVIILEAGLPLLNNMRDRNTLYTTQEQFIALADIIQQLRGPGSQITYTLNVKAGDISFSNSTGLVYVLETPAEIIYPGASINYGGVELSSGANVNATKIGNYAVIENNYLLINLSLVGNSTNYTVIDTSDLINSIYFKDTAETLPGTLEFIINNDPALSIGTGYSELLDEGTNLAYARFKTIIANAVNYTLMFTLRGESDFIEVDLI